MSIGDIYPIYNTGRCRYNEIFSDDEKKILTYRSMPEYTPNYEASTCASSECIFTDENENIERVDENEKPSVLPVRNGPIKTVKRRFQMIFTRSFNAAPSILRNPTCSSPIFPLKKEEARAIQNFIYSYDKSPFKRRGLDVHISRAEALKYRNIKISLSLSKTVKNEWIVHLKKKRGQLLGKGSFKVVKTALVFFSGEIVASATVKYSRSISVMEKDREMSLGKQLQVVPGLVGIRSSYEYTSKRWERKTGFIMDYYNHGDMERLRGKLDFQDKLRVLDGFLHGLKNLHERRIWHRDIKVENIIVKKTSGKVDSAITDFGFSVPRGGCTYKFQGTPFCMAPEMYSDNGKMTFSTIGEKSDIYSAGVAVVEIMGGSLPSVFYERNFAKHGRLMQRLLKMNFHDLQRDYSNFLKAMGEVQTDNPVRDAIIKIAAQCLEIRPSKRPTAEELYQSFLVHVRSGQHTKWRIQPLRRCKNT
ncbi:MAG: hypothetical protein ACI8RA_001494 [Chlamydiales bacterium]|jgi:hypothetical protein